MNDTQSWDRPYDGERGGEEKLSRAEQRLLLHSKLEAEDAHAENVGQHASKVDYHKR